MNASLVSSVALFVVAALAVWIAGTQLAIAAEEISDRKKLGKEIMGLVFLAAATELPETVTTLYAAIDGAAHLLLNNMFGGIALQTAILVVADMVAVHAAITQYPRKLTPMLEGVFLILILALLQAIIMLGEVRIFGHVGLGATILAVLYILVIYLLRDQDQKTVWLPVEMPEPPVGNKVELLRTVAHETDQRLYFRFSLATLAILVFGVVLVVSAERIATLSGLGTSFIGATILAGSTSLPELSTTIMAVRLHSYTMAISNIFGSNLIMVLLILPADIAYTAGPVLDHADKSAIFALTCGIVVTAIYVIGMMIRVHRRIFGMGYDSLTVLVVYVVSLFGLYALR